MGAGKRTREGWEGRAVCVYVCVYVCVLSYLVRGMLQWLWRGVGGGRTDNTTHLTARHNRLGKRCRDLAAQRLEARVVPWAGGGH